MATRPQSCGPPSAAQDVANLGVVRPPLVYLISLVTGALTQLATLFHSFLERLRCRLEHLLSWLP